MEEKISNLSFSGAIGVIKKLWPWMILITGKPYHSDSNRGVKWRNRTVEEKISKWLHENNTSQWAQDLPFIQRFCHGELVEGCYTI